MAYSDIITVPLTTPAGLALNSAAGNYGFWSSSRPYTLLGFFLLCTVAAVGGETTKAVLNIQKGPYAKPGTATTFANIAGMTVTPSLADGVNLGNVSETSALLKAVDPKTGVAPTGSNAYIASVDLAPGDVIAGNIGTAASYVTTNPSGIIYALIVRRGS